MRSPRSPNRGTGGGSARSTLRPPRYTRGEAEIDFPLRSVHRHEQKKETSMQELTPAAATEGRIRSRWAVLPLMGVILAGPGCAEPPPGEDPAEILPAARQMFDTIQAFPASFLDAPDVELGRALFWDERLSRNGATSCASCHTRENWGSDARQLSIDARGELTGRQSQTVFNSMAQRSIRWRGDRETGAEQAQGSIVGSMGMDDPEEMVELMHELGYEGRFRAAFPDDPAPVSAENYGRALEVYQSTLVTPAPFDEYLAGDPSALTDEQVEGLELFVSTGCGSCHGGKLLGGGAFQRFGILEDYWTVTGSEEIDEGRYAVTGREEDRYVFRVPMLRNVVRTGPYFHDGSVASLGEAVEIMARVQLGRELDPVEVERITLFLESLTGEIPEGYSSPH